MSHLSEALALLRRDFSIAATRAKLAALNHACVQQAAAIGEWRSLHDECVYCLAYPDSREIAGAAEKALANIAARVAQHTPRSAKRRNGRPLSNSGIAHTDVVTTFSVDLARWLIALAARRAEIDWSDDAGCAGIESLLPLIAAHAEIDGTRSTALSTRAWIERARRGSGKTALAWIVQQVARLTHRADVLDLIYEAGRVPIRWRLARDSRTFTRFPPRTIFCHHDGLHRDRQIGELIEARLPPCVTLSSPAARRLIDVARATLGARGRETDPVTYANPREVTLYRLERGVDVALFGMLPERRLPIESYFGFVAAKNRVPIAYGGGWVFFERCEIGVNLFEEFRGGESAHIFGQVMRVYRQHFGVRQFLVDPYQFGADNPEAIRSGAFWFYYRLGFRPVDAALRALADRESARLHAEHGARSTTGTLKRLAGGKIFLDVPAPAQPARAWTPIAPDLERLSLRVTDWLSRLHRGDRTRAEATARRIALQRLRGSNWTVRAAEQDLWFGRLAPLIAALPGSLFRDAGFVKSVAAAVRAKGGSTELAFVRRMQLAGGLKHALLEL